MKETIFVPPIKSQGIKTKLVPWIKKLIPNSFDGVWIEPFMGTGVVAFNVMPKKAILCDTNPHLINFYNCLKDGSIDSGLVTDHLEKEGHKLLTSNGEYFYEVRERFNKYGNPLDFLFINRSCFNGMIRFNGKGGFNVPFCKKPNRFAQAYITKISNQVNRISNIISKGDFEFHCQPFIETIRMASTDDIIYCDPPYIGRHADYFNSWGHEDELSLFEKLDSTQAKFIMSTWHHNDFRKNDYIDMLWKKFAILTKEHFYHVGASEKNRSPMIEALITNIPESIENAIKRNETDIVFIE